MKPLLSILLVTLFALVSLSACGGAQAEPVRIGLIVYLEGEAMTINSSGQPSLNGAELAVDQINASGGLRINGRSHPVELVVASTENDAEQAVAAARRLIEQEGVVALVGPQYSGDAIPVGGIAEEAGIPMISGTSTNPLTTENRRFVFRATFTDDLQAVALADLAYSDLRARRVAVMYDQEDPYSSGLALMFSESFINYGGLIVASEPFDPNDWDMDDHFARIIEANPDLVLLPVFPAHAAYQVASLRKMGYGGHLIGSDGWDSLLLVNLPDFEGTYATTTYSVKVRTPENEVFINEYMAVFNTEPLDSAGLIFDAFNMIFAAIELEQSFDPAAIRDGLYNLPAYTGVSGMIDFVESGDPRKPINVLKFEQGEVIFYKAIQP
ncbi:MAG: ABC transporter substrate-binding protein [Anaerolineales bacterium]